MYSVKRRYIYPMPTYKGADGKGPRGNMSSQRWWLSVRGTRHASTDQGCTQHPSLIYHGRIPPHRQPLLPVGQFKYLKGVPNWTHAPMHDAPTAAIPKAWRPYVLDESERVVDPRGLRLFYHRCVAHGHQTSRCPTLKNNS
jgi:hypothetical protein